MKSMTSLVLIRQKMATAIILLSCGLLLLQSCSQSTEEQKKRQSLPDFHFEDIKGGVFQRSDLPADKPVTIAYFDPDCSHCQETIEQLVAHIDAFGDNMLALVSPASRSQVMPYLSEKGLLGRDGVRVALCTPQQFLDTFGTTETPTTLFYGGDFDLKMAIKGPMDSQGVLNGLAAARD
jgi:hypothetical protein